MSPDDALRAYLLLGALLFVCGAVCMAMKRNAIGVLMGVELVLNGATVNFVAFAHYNSAFEVEGQIFALFVIVLAIPLMIALTLFVQRTRLGKAMRATAQDRTAEAIMGIDINTTIALTLLIGGAMAGAAGTIYGLYNNSAWFFQGFRNGLYSFTAAVMGGIGNIQGAFLGGMLIGVVAAIADRVWDPRWTEAVVFGLLVIILIFKPTGLLGEGAAISLQTASTSSQTLSFTASISVSRLARGPGTAWAGSLLLISASATA